MNYIGARLSTKDRRWSTTSSEKIPKTFHELRRGCPPSLIRARTDVSWWLIDVNRQRVPTFISSAQGNYWINRHWRDLACSRAFNSVVWKQYVHWSNFIRWWYLITWTTAKNILRFWISQNTIIRRSSSVHSSQDRIDGWWRRATSC